MPTLLGKRRNILLQKFIDKYPSVRTGATNGRNICPGGELRFPRCGKIIRQIQKWPILDTRDKYRREGPGEILGKNRVQLMPVCNASSKSIKNIRDGLR